MIDSTAITRELGARLRECREQLGLKGYEVANTLGWPASKVSRLENGVRLAEPLDVAMFLGCCGVTQTIAKPLLDLAKLPDDGFWVQPHRLLVPDRLLALSMNETAASTICNFQLALIPGLVQTPTYAAESFRGVISVEPDKIPPMVQARQVRQTLLSRPYPPQTIFFINESVLHCPVGGPSVMQEQLLHLVFATAKPQIKVRIIPTSVGAHAGMRGPFVLMHYQDRRPMVWLESEATSMLVEDREVVETYRKIRAELYRIALDEEQSRLLLANLASDYDKSIAHSRP
jgi:transcriptional regulator with XRE-family HTH domain